MEPQMVTVTALVVLSALNLVATVALGAVIWQTKASWDRILQAIKQARRR